MKFRISQWLDIEAQKLVWGIDAKAADWSRWRPCMEGGVPLAFADMQLALAKQTELELRCQKGDLFSGEARNANERSSS